MLDGEGDQESLRFDRVLVSVGRVPNSDELGLEHTKAEIDDQGFVVTDSKKRTADPWMPAADVGRGLRGLTLNLPSGL